MTDERLTNLATGP